MLVSSYLGGQLTFFSSSSIFFSSRGSDTRPEKRAFLLVNLLFRGGVGREGDGENWVSANKWGGGNENERQWSQKFGMCKARLIRRPGADAVEMGEGGFLVSTLAFVVPEKRVVGKGWKCDGGRPVAQEIEAGRKRARTQRSSDRSAGF